MAEPTNIISPSGEPTTALNTEGATGDVSFGTQTVYEPEVRGHTRSTSAATDALFLRPIFSWQLNEEIWIL